MKSTREEYRAALQAMSDEDLFHRCADDYRRWKDYHDDDDGALVNMCEDECAKPGRAGIWDAAVRVAKAAGRHGRVTGRLADEIEKGTSDEK